MVKKIELKFQTVIVSEYINSSFHRALCEYIITCYFSSPLDNLNQK